MQLSGKRIVVTGAHGFLGREAVSHLEKKQCDAIITPTSKECDLLDAGAVGQLFRGTKPDVVFHLAARVGGIGANQVNPGSYFYDNLLMGMNVLEQARLQDVPKTVLVGTICSYPKFAAIPFREEDLWSGYPEETNAPYGIAKKALMVMADAYRRQYGLNSLCLLPVNLYGPGDNFDLETSHVIPAMIRKFTEAVALGVPKVTLWGDGSPTREFLYVSDCAEALLLAAERYESSDPCNIGAGAEISMASLAKRIAELAGFRGDILWDASRPNGQPRRMLDTQKASERFGFSARMSLDDGLAKTIAWYKANRLTRAGV